MRKEEDVTVSVLMPVYNHEKYIAKAIDGVLMQKTNFRFELIIGEDCSKDYSRRIVRQYQKKYPNIIKVIYQTTNKGMQKNIGRIQREASGKYWAYCEGDDYWTDENKLQKQIEFLEKNKKYNAVYHNVLCVDQKGRPCKRKSINKYPLKPSGSYTFNMIQNMNLVGQTASLVCRNVYDILQNNKDIKWFETCNCNGDQKLCALLACSGNIYFLNEIMAVHRVVLKEGTSWSAVTQQKNLSLYMYNSCIELNKLLYHIYKRNCCSKEYLKNLQQTACEEFYRKPNLENLVILICLNLRYIKDAVIWKTGKRTRFE